jgi:hypothetical protein
MQLTGAVATRTGGKRLGPLLQQLRELCDEVVVVVDSLSVDDSEAVAREYTDRVFRFEHDDAFINMKRAYIEHARGEWLLRIDDDETLSPQWTRPLVDEVMATRRATHVLTPIRWIVPPGDRAIITGRWYPNMVPRMGRNIRSLAVHGRSAHEPVWMAGESLHVADHHVYHWNLAINSRATRERKASMYERENPADSLGEVYLFEDEEFETARFDDRPVDRIASPLEGAPSTSRFAVDCRILEAPPRMRSGHRYAVLVEVANRSTRPLLASSRFLSESPFWLALRWSRREQPDGGHVASQTPMPATLEPMTSRRYLLTVDAPAEFGTYVLAADVLEQNVAWYSQTEDGGASVPAFIEVAPGK